MDVPILRFDRSSRPKAQALLADSAVWVEIVRGRVRQRIRAVRRPAFLIGTAQDCDLVLGDQTFPDAYAYVLVQDEKVTIRRVGDGPPLFINGERVDSADLYHGDRIGLGQFELRIVIRERPQLAVTELSPALNGRWLWDGDLAEL